MKKLLNYFMAVAALVALRSEMSAATTAAQNVTISDITDALVENQWKWTLNVSEGTETVILELVELTYQDGTVVEKSIIGEGGWFAAPIWGETENPLVIIRFSYPDRVFFKLGILRGTYELPEWFQWPSSQLMIGKWRGEYLILVDDADGYDSKSGLAKRSIALKIKESKH